MFEDTFELETAIVPHDSASVVTRQLSVEILAEIFVQCIPPLIPSEPEKLPKFETHPRQIRANLAQVCQFWYTVLNDEPRVWGTLALDYPNPDPEIVSLWLKKSKSCLLDVYIDSYRWNINPEPKNQYHPALPDISSLLYNELTRMRSLFATDPFMNSISSLPAICGGHTILPRMESLNLIPFYYPSDWNARFSFPRLRTLAVTDIEVLIDGSMPNVHHLDIFESPDKEAGDIVDIWSYRLLQTVPNLVSLTWSIDTSSSLLKQPPVVLPFLKFLSLPTYHREMTLPALQCFVAPSLENLDLGFLTSVDERIRGWSTSPARNEAMKEALDVICRDESIQLRHFTLRCLCKSVNIRAMSPHLDHLDSLTIYDPSP